MDDSYMLTVNLVRGSTGEYWYAPYPTKDTIDTQRIRVTNQLTSEAMLKRYFRKYLIRGAFRAPTEKWAVVVLPISRAGLEKMRLTDITLRILGEIDVVIHPNMLRGAYNFRVAQARMCKKQRPASSPSGEEQPLPDNPVVYYRGTCPGCGITRTVADPTDPCGYCQNSATQWVTL
jgi:hypothetical protein